MTRSGAFWRAASALPSSPPGCASSCLGAALLLCLAAATWPWGSWLLWPGAALSIVTTAYYGVGPGIFRKHAGRLPLSTWVLLGPVLLGQYLSLQYYRRQCRPWD